MVDAIKNRSQHQDLALSTFCAFGISLLLIGLWGFPNIWYTQVDQSRERFWFSSKGEVTGYDFVNHPIGDAMERRLVADETFNGQFLDTSDNAILAFIAKRHSESINEIGLFVHTPDRCWTEGGWKIQPIQPDYVEVEVQGDKIGFERRLFIAGSRFELVYFTGMVGGQTLPYRLDHNLSVAMKYQFEKERENTTGTSNRMLDSKLWGRVWDSFRSRRPLLGPKQFIRVSTTVQAGQLEKGDDRLKDFLGQWLVRDDYVQEIEAWENAKASEQGDPDDK